MGLRSITAMRDRVFSPRQTSRGTTTRNRGDAYVEGDFEHRPRFSVAVPVKGTPLFKATCASHLSSPRHLHERQGVSARYSTGLSLLPQRFTYRT